MNALSFNSPQYLFKPLNNAFDLNIPDDYNELADQLEIIASNLEERAKDIASRRPNLGERACAGILLY